MTIMYSRIEKLMTETTNLKLNNEIFKKLVKETTDLKLRSGIIDLFENIFKYKVKIYIVSGGLHELIDEILSEAIPIYQKLKQENLITILANELYYDRHGYSVSYKTPIMYTFNKSKVLYL